jgi:ADP-heptose:LPS heptosyltransferase
VVESPEQVTETGAHTWPAIGYGTLPLRRILLVQTQRLGDVLCATPLVTAVRRQFPRAQVTALVQRPMDQILEHNPDLDEVLTYDRFTTHRRMVDRLRFITELRERQFDWALSVHAASSVSFALWQSGILWRTAVWRYGARRKPHWAGMFHQHVRQDRLAGEKHEIEHNLDALRELGIQPSHEGYRVRLLPEERAWAREWLRARGRDGGRPLAVIHPGHGGGRQAWPAEQYAAVGDGLHEMGYQVAVTGSGGERELVERVTGSMRAPGLPLAGGMSLRQFAAVLAEASRFVSVSTGPMHLASALKVPAVTLYGPTDLLIESTRFCPYGSPAIAVKSAVRCICAGSKECPNPVCMTGITPTMVLEAADGLRRCSGTQVSGCTGNTSGLLSTPEHPAPQARNT